jgi:outer membrane protein TolC
MIRALARAVAIALALFAGPFPTPVAAAPLGEERALSLEEAIAWALEKNENILIERESVIAADALVSAAKGAYDPLLELGGGWQRATDPVNSAFSGAPAGEPAPTIEIGDAGASLHQLLPTGGAVSLRAGGARTLSNGTFDLLSPSYGTQLGVELRQPLLRDRGIDPARFTIRAASADRNRSLAELRREITETVAEVERAYWTLAAARRAVEVEEEAVRLAEEQETETSARIEKGAAPENEIAQPRAEVERRRGVLFATQELASRLENELKLLILGDADDTALWSARLAPDVEEEPERATVDVGIAMEQALVSRPELEAAAALVERRRAESALAHDGVWPTLDAVVSYDRFGLAGSRNPDVVIPPGLSGDIPPNRVGEWGTSFDVLADGDYDDTRVGLELAYPIGNRTARHTSRAARSVERQAEADLVRLRKAIRTEVLDAAAALETASQRIDAARSGREAAEVQLDAEQDRYDVGLSTNFLVLTRQNDLSRARLAEISSLNDYRTARTEMARATASLLEQRNIDIEANTP